MKQRQQDLLHGPLFLNIVTYTIPIILTSLLHLLFNAADLIIVGRFCGSISVAAVGATGSIINLIVNLFMGLSIGAGVCMAHAVGGQNEEAMHHTVHTAIPTAFISGILLTVIGVFFAETFLVWMGTPENVLPLSTIYIQLYFSAMAFIMVFNFAAAILRAIGDTKTPLIALTTAGILNVLMNVFFVTVCHMDVAGIGLATALSQIVAAGLAIRALMRRTDACRLSLKELHIYRPQLIKIISHGLPAGIQGSLFSISNVLIQSSVNSFGDIFMSGNAAAVNIEGFVYVCMNAFSQTAVNFIGQNVGARQYQRVGKIMMLCFACVSVVGIVVGGITYLLSPSLLSIYITDSSEAIGYGVLRLGFVALPYFLLGLLDVSTGVLRGLGSSLSPMVISVLGVCFFRVAWIYTIFQIPQYHTPSWLFVSYPISWVLTFLAQFAACLLIYRKQLQAH